MRLYRRSVMLFRTKSPHDKLLDGAINDALVKMRHQVAGSKEYYEMLTLVDKLQKMKDDKKSSSPSKDTLALIFGNLLGIILIIKHENVNVITSRAMQLLIKPK